MLLLLAAALPLMLSSCATPLPRAPQVFHKMDDSAIIIKSFDHNPCELMTPTPSVRVENARVLNQAKSLPQHQTAIVILENFSEPQLGQQFRDRTVEWFVALRGLGYQHIFFLQGANVVDPDNLITLAEYH